MSFFASSTLILTNIIDVVNFIDAVMMIRVFDMIVIIDFFIEDAALNVNVFNFSAYLIC